MGNFSIDLSEQFTSLRNAPIVEAVIQFNAPPVEPFEQTKLKELLELRFAGYKLHGQVQVEAGFESSVDGNVAMHHKSHWDGFRLQSDDCKYICQWKRSSLVFSRLQPYETWPKLLQAAMPFWTAYQEVGRPDIIEGIGVRFISQIPVKENEKLSKFVQKIHPPLIGLGLRANSFFHQDTIPLKGYPYEVRLIRTLQPAAEKSGSRKILIVDIDVSTTRAVTLDQLEKALNEMRYIKNKVFFTYMKDAEERFK
ncbi:MAG TPA: TIGR04255 family protein [Pirellulaceae bacterium]|nr:TIGR04255 family protein [Pirellulaceae bacterium]HMO94353.1 TIGR04255 family protein [Pirellulaceae bacterium]HMP71392.1 TIGR04255 family protein [Pirellulaceae bacterium]